MNQKIRRGNDIEITWSLYDSENDPYIVDGRNFVVELCNEYGKVQPSNVTSEGNRIHFYYRGKDQKYLGSYALKYIENGGQVDMVTFDTKDAFFIVAHSWQAVDTGETPETIQIEVVTISSELNSVIGPRGYSAYEIAVQHGFVGTEEEWLASLHGDDGHTPVITADENGVFYVDGELLTDVVKRVMDNVRENEAGRVEAEAGRVLAEQGRVSAEGGRVDAETLRVNAESQRASAESSRASAESSRQGAESGRVSAESGRVDAEAGRVSAESERVTEFAGIKSEAQTATGAANDAAQRANTAAGVSEADHLIAVSDHGTAAADHTQAGNDHTRAEGDHSTAADDHTLAGTDHNTAASDHTLAGTDHQTAASDHTTASNDHTTAGNDHTTAGNDHTRAESDHTRAESDHAVVEGYNTRLTNVEGEVSQLGQKEDGDKRILNGNYIPFKNGYFYRVDRNQEVYAENNSYCRIRVNAGDKFLVTGTSKSTAAPFITVQEDDGTNHIAQNTSGTNLLYTVGFNGWLIVNNLSSTVVPALKQTTDRFESIEGQVSTLNGQVSNLNSQISSKIDLSQVEFARRTIFNGGNVPFIEGKYWNTTNNEEGTDSSHKYSRIFLFSGTKIKVTARSTSPSAKMLTEFPIDGSSPIISAETDVENYEYTMQKDGYLAVNSVMVLTISYVKVESNVPDYNVEVDVQNAKQKIGTLEETISLTSADYANLWSNGKKVFSSNLSTYNGFVVPLHPGTKYTWSVEIYYAVVLSAYPVTGATDTIIGIVDSGFTATPAMKYLLISLVLATTTAMSVVTTGHGIERDVISLKDTVWKNQIVPLDLVSGKLNGNGIIVPNSAYIVTRNFIDVTNNVLLTDGLLPSYFCFYDKNEGFLHYDTSFNEAHLEEASYCRLVFKAEDIAKLNGVYNGDFVNEPFPRYENITRMGTQISNGLETTSASGVVMSYDKSSGIMAAAYAGGWLHYGEDGSKIILSVFPLMQPSNIKYVDVATEGESIGNGLVYHNGIDVNIISLGSRVWRIMFLSHRGTPQEAFWAYRDYHYDTDTLDDAVEIKMSYGGNLLSLNTDNRKLVINAISGLTDTASNKFVTISSSLDYHSDEGANGTYYGCITGYGYTGDDPDNVYVLLFSSTDNMATVVPFAVFPYSTMFEASCIKIDGRFYCIGRQNGGIYHTGYSDDNGATWVYTSIPGTNNRPRLYRVNNVPLWCYGLLSVNERIKARSKIAIAQSTDPTDIQKVLEDNWGLSYFDVFLKNGKMFVAYSCSPLSIDLDNGESSFDGKDCVKLVTL